MSERELIKRCAECLEAAGTMATESMDWISEAGELEKACREYLSDDPKERKDV